MKQWELRSCLGPLFLVASEKGLTGIYWKKRAVPLLPSLEGDDPEEVILKKASSQLNEYFEGNRKAFDLPLDIQGTPFQMQVWNELSKIPFGETMSYSAIAIRLKNKKAVRAVGAANGRNPLSIIIPCHRVIAATGKLTGYAGGLSNKEKLLHLERGSGPLFANK